MNSPVINIDHCSSSATEYLDGGNVSREEACLLDNLASLKPANDKSFIFIQNGKELKLTHVEIMQRVDHVAAALLQRELVAGDTVGICLSNRLEFVLLDLAALKLGLVVAAFDIKKFTAGTALVQEYNLSVLFSEDKVDGAIQVDEFFSHAVPALSSEAESINWHKYEFSDEVALKFTSGSTGKAKGLAATWGSIGASINSSQNMFCHNRDDMLFVFLTLSLLQQRYWVYTALLYQTDIMVSTPGLAFFDIQRCKPTVVMGIPSFYENLAQLIDETAVCMAELDDSDISADTLQQEAVRQVTGGKVRYMWTGSAPIRKSLVEYFHHQCNIPLYEGYGMNETCIVTKNYPGHCKIGSAGKPVPGKSISIDKNGIVNVYSQYPVNNAYRFAPSDANGKVFTGHNTVTTGDLGYIDADGYLWIEGRSDDLIVLESGVNVKVREIEDTVMGLGLVKHCVVVGTGLPSLCLIVDTKATQLDVGDQKHILDVVNANLSANSPLTYVLQTVSPFTEENGLLTSQGKTCRKKIVELHKSQLNKLFKGEYL